MNFNATLSSDTYDLRDYSTSYIPHKNWLFKLIWQWLEEIEICNPKVAHLLSKLIPGRCPFERTIELFGYRILHIPPLCKLNPFYEPLMGLRFRALSFLADTCGEDVSQYYG